MVETTTLFKGIGFTAGGAGGLYLSSYAPKSFRSLIIGGSLIVGGYGIYTM